jgi:predicted XRE-type DNA-binding protein
VVHRCRFVNDVPLNASHAEVRVNFIEYWEISQDKVQHFSWVTALRVTKRHVLHLMRGGRARWKIANATCNTLKHQGDHVEHTYGHGVQHLSGVLAMLRMLACLVDQTQQWCWAWFRAVWTKLGSKRLLWERMRALFYDDALMSMRPLFEALLYGFQKSSPLVMIDST